MCHAKILPMDMTAATRPLRLISFRWKVDNGTNHRVNRMEPKSSCKKPLLPQQVLLLVAIVAKAPS